ncbi:MAG TPA: hypothetical protein DCQ06_12060 [Myxococcales bacterium]|nr:hypothetical protein [Myxococcales bacterium]HAN32321.1 hypothetical protein [Myxococcales bacterium]
MRGPAGIINHNSALALLFVCFVTLGCGTDSLEDGLKKKPDAGSTEEDAGPKASCVGVASASRQLFGQYDNQCAFLTDCAESGKCYCGKGCTKDKTQCSAALCATVDSDCWCGDECDDQTDKIQCPQYVCKDKQISGCEKQAGCKYLGQEMESKCKCTTMPDTAPPCYCGDACSADKTLCVPAKCVGKNPNKCIIVPGETYTTPYCALCGLLGTQPKCFFVISP